MSTLSLLNQNLLNRELTTLDLLNCKLVNLNNDTSIEFDNDSSNVENVENCVETEDTTETTNKTVIQEEITISTPVNISTPLDVDTISLSITKPVICAVCGRKLKDPQSRIIGMGPMCAKHHRQQNRKRQFNLFTGERIIS